MQDLIAFLMRLRVWSSRTFGPGRRADGIVDHIKKELKEVEKDPMDVFEWIDIVLLAFDGAMTAGWTPPEIVKALLEKQRTNELRLWPDWRLHQGKAIEHIKEPK
jgi:hypothetical protein